MTNPDRPPVPLGYETPSSRRPAATLPGVRHSAAPTRSPAPTRRPITPPGPWFGLTVAGLFVMLVIAVVAIVEVVGR